MILYIRWLLNPLHSFAVQVLSHARRWSIFEAGKMRVMGKCLFDPSTLQNDEDQNHYIDGLSFTLPSHPTLDMYVFTGPSLLAIFLFATLFATKRNGFFIFFSILKITLPGTTRPACGGSQVAWGNEHNVRSGCRWGHTSGGWSQGFDDFLVHFLPNEHHQVQIPKY